MLVAYILARTFVRSDQHQKCSKMSDVLLLFSCSANLIELLGSTKEQIDTVKTKYHTAITGHNGIRLSDKALLVWPIF